MFSSQPLTSAAISKMWGTVLYYLAVVLLIRQLYCWALWVISLVQQAMERSTAPTISIVPPVTPSSTPTPERASKRITPVIDGNPNEIQCYDKGTNAPLGKVAVVTATKLDDIVKRARAAQKQWAETPFSTRRKLLFSLMNYVIKYHREICATSCTECGKTMIDGEFGEILTTLEKLRWTCAQGENVLAEEVRDVGLITAHKRASLCYYPIGVVGAIVSWNYPFHNIVGPMISALFAGNAFIGKVSEYTSFYVSFYESIVRDGLSQLGQSPDLVHFITGFAATGEALVERVDKITFIGSPGVGKKVMEKASKTLTPVLLELGGKDPAIVCDDADLSQVVPILMRGTFQNCGQNCVGLERVLVQEAIYDKLVAQLLEQVKKLSQGPSSISNCKDTGAMTMGTLSVEKIGKLIDETVKAGARLLHGGKAEPGCFFPPTMIVDVTPSMPIARDEVFGPVLVMMKFRSDEEAINMVNDCPYGLGSSVFSSDIPRARRISHRLHTGMCNINDFAINYLCQSLPFGGTKISGFDRFAGVEGLRGNCLLRAKTEDRIPGVKTIIPRVLQYPIKENAVDFVNLDRKSVV